MSRSPLAPVRGWSDADRQRYRDLGYWTDETFAEFVVDRTTRFAAGVAVVGRDARGETVRWTYAELGERSREAAVRFRAAGVQPGDRVVVTLPNIVEYVSAVLGLFRMGALPVFGLPTHREVELTQFCSLADAAAIVVATGEHGADGVDREALYREVAVRVADRGVTPPALVDVSTWDQPVTGDVPPATADAHGVAFLQLSGGTTGVSKLIPRTHADYLYSVRASAEICAWDAATVQLVVLPAAHNFAMSSPGILGVLGVGGTVVLARDPSPRTAFALIAAERVTTAALVPPLAQAWISAARRRSPDLSSLRTVQVGGARLADTVAPAIADVLGARLQQVFGMAEGLVNYTRDDDPDELVTTTQGRPISEHDEIRIVDEDDREVPAGESGSLLTRGPYTIRGYYRSPQADTDSFTADGFYRTGDVVRQLPSGHLIVIGRLKEQINRGGEKVSTEELEGFALAHADVLDAVAVGLPDEYLGERTCLVVVTEPSRPRPDDLVDFLRAAGLATFKIPDQVVFVDALPATHVGKNSRRDLRQLLVEQLTTTS